MCGNNGYTQLTTFGRTAGGPLSAVDAAQCFSCRFTLTGLDASVSQISQAEANKRSCNSLWPSLST